MADEKNDFEVGPREVYGLTGRGQRELRESGTSLSAAELELLVLIDGTSTVAQIERRAKKQTPEQVRATLRKLYRGGFIDRSKNLKKSGLDFFSVTMPLQIPKGAAARSSDEAKEGVSSLQEKGYFVRIARRSPSGHPLPEDRNPVMLVIDDDETLVKLLHTVFRLEGFDLRTAGNRAEIVDAFAAEPPPDFILLDVMLPDIDGFEVLGRIRSHPVVKNVPVIMLTAKATREDVVNGLYLGADGYVTKPFEIEALMSAVRTVLGPGQAGGRPKGGGGPIRND
ncbi:MAG: response regulator [Betaproteobacteria bacterium]|jgi:two-component system OmpR family response regulator|nr:response regulator [Betaproteobacteria bacterium]